MLKLGRKYDNFIIFIIFVKIIFVIFTLIEKYYGYQIIHNPLTADKKQYYVENYTWAFYWKEWLEFIFIILMALVCIIIFYPYYSDTIYIDKETRLLLFIYGFIILITANWSIIFNLPPWVSQLQSIVGTQKYNSQS